MAKFKPNQLRGDAPHKVVVKLVVPDDDGVKQVVETEVFYRGIPLDEVPTFPNVEGLAGKERIEVVKQQLAQLVTRIPDFGVGPGDGEQPADEAYFGAMDDAHVTAISEAIQEDRDPNTKPSDS